MSYLQDPTDSTDEHRRTHLLDLAVHHLRHLRLAQALRGLFGLCVCMHLGVRPSPWSWSCECAQDRNGQNDRPVPDRLTLTRAYNSRCSRPVRRSKRASNCMCVWGGWGNIRRESAPSMPTPRSTIPIHSFTRHIQTHLRAVPNKTPHDIWVVGNVIPAQAHGARGGGELGRQDRERRGL